jgi:hypothetical protein
MKKFIKRAQDGYLLRVSVRFRTFRDTVRECNARRQAWGPYVNGVTAPHFPAPTIPLLVSITGDVDDPFHSSVAVRRRGSQHLVAIWDFCFDRCMDFHYKMGEYVNAREIDNGIRKYMRGQNRVQKNSNLR